MNEYELKQAFLQYLDKEGSVKDIPHFPDKVLDIVVKETINSTYNGVSFSEALDTHRLYSYIYRHWKSNYRIFLKAYVPNSRVNMTFGESGFTPKNIYDHRQKFETLFSIIDAKGIFDEVEWP